MQRTALALLLVFVFAVPWEYSLDLGEPLGNVARIAGVILLFGAILMVLSGRGMRTLGALQWLVLGFYLYFAMSYFWTLDQDATLEKIRAYFQVMMIVWLAWEIANEPGDLLAMLHAFVFGCWILAILTFIDFSSVSSIAAQQIRFVAEGQDPNDVARFLDLGFPLAALLFAVGRHWLLRLIALAYLPVGVLAVLLTASRGGFSGSLVALAGSAILLLVWRPQASVAFLAGVGATASLIWVFVPLESLDRLATIPEQVGSADLNDRLSIWISGWHAFQLSPWFGYGAGTYASASRLSPGDTAHNTAMAVLVTGGLIGLCIFVGILAAATWAAFKTRSLLRIGLVTALAVWLLTAMVGSVEENRTTWVIFAIMGVAGRMAREKSSGLEQVFSGVRELELTSGYPSGFPADL